MNYKVLWLKERLDVFEAKVEKSEKAGSRRELNPGHLTCAASALPLSYDNRTTTNPHNPLLWLLVKVFSVKFRGVASIRSTSKQSVKVFSTEIAKVSSSKAFLLYGINTTTCTQLCGCCYWLMIMSSVLATNCGLGLHASQNGGDLSLHKAVSMTTRLNSLGEL